MARTFIEYYSEHEKTVLLQRYTVLPEKNQRHFLANEYLRLGSGSQSYLARFFRSSKDRIRRGVREITQENFIPDYTKQRLSGGGRKKKK